MVIELKIKTEKELKKEKELTNGIYAVWFMGFINGTLLVSMLFTLFYKELWLGTAMFFLWVITLPPLRKEKFISMWKEEKRNGTNK
jgi:hypothetical protein